MPKENKIDRMLSTILDVIEKNDHSPVDLPVVVTCSDPKDCKTVLSHVEEIGGGPRGGNPVEGDEIRCTIPSNEILAIACQDTVKAIRLTRMHQVHHEKRGNDGSNP